MDKEYRTGQFVDPFRSGLHCKCLVGWDRFSVIELSDMGGVHLLPFRFVEGRMADETLHADQYKGILILGGELSCDM